MATKRNESRCVYEAAFLAIVGAVMALWVAWTIYGMATKAQKWVEIEVQAQQARIETSMDIEEMRKLALKEFSHRRDLEILYWEYLKDSYRIYLYFAGIPLLVLLPLFKLWRHQRKNLTSASS